MKYAHVASTPSAKGVDYNRAIMAQNNVCLFSIIEGMRQQNFNTHTLNRALGIIMEYAANYVWPHAGEIFIDSGGYSIIRGDVHPTAIPRYIQCYNTLLRLDGGTFDKIFSLDIPWNRGFTEMNTKEKIFAFNDYALGTARDVLMGSPAALERYSFVWHFKMQSQYEIWERLYAKHELNSFIRHRAIGGMVALRGATGIRFSPFIGMSYRCLLDYQDAGRFDHPFSLHYLGMYLPYDRFEMALLDELFRRYLEGEAPVQTTYDSINPSHAARMNKSVPLFEFRGGNLHVHGNLSDAPAGLLKHVYLEDSLVQFVQEEINRRRVGERIQNINSFGPLNIFSHRQVDLFFEHVVKKHGLAEVFSDEWSLTKINGRFNEILKRLSAEHPALFTRSLIASIMQNVAITYEFHRWFVEDRSRGSLHQLMLSNIRQIKFPGRLA